VLLGLKTDAYAESGSILRPLAKKDTATNAVADLINQKITGTARNAIPAL
jgi:hypothetical protein